MKSKYYNDAIIGNKDMIATFSDKGELLRLLYPNRDFKQSIDFFITGVKINDSAFINLHDDINNVYEQSYVGNTNILCTEIENTYFNLKVEQVDFIPINKDILVKKYKFTNNNTITLNTKFFVYSAILTNYNNMVSGRIGNDSLIQYTHDYSICIFSKEKIDSFQINDTDNNLRTGYIGGKDYIGMSPDSSICYDLGELLPGESKEIQLFIFINNNEENDFIKLDEIIEKNRKIQVSRELKSTENYWEKYVAGHIDDDKMNKIEKMDYSSKIKQIYIRSILLFPLLVNYKTGGIAAGIEVDEKLDYCGRYAYCWARDAVFITRAFNLLKMEKETEKFYRDFCKNTQSKNGMWEQRFYTDGRLAPCWGYQIDETASVIYGVYEHFKCVRDLKFLKDMFSVCENAASYLKKYVENICLDDKHMQESYDLWEMTEGVHTYSLASIFGAFNAMIKIYEIIKDTYQNNRLKQDAIIKDINELKKYIYKLNNYVSKNLIDENKKIILRNNKDELTDISVIGSVVPFNMFTPKDRKVKNTVEKMEMTLRTYTGGFLRFEKDNYRGGNAPWPITTLWMSMYYNKVGEIEKAKQGFEFVVKSATKHGLLAEQVDNSTMQSNWVIGLGWSHAMFISYLFEI